MVDLDDLKVINDRLGHQVGDQVLKEVAWTLKTSVRNCDAVARYGGDEFAIILVETGKTDAMTTANRLSRLVRVVDGHGGGLADKGRPMTISIGVVSYPTNGKVKAELIRSADGALYDAKSPGGDCVRPATP